jgi:hypothetical protein
MSEDEKPTIEIDLEDYCFCGCHAELLQTAVTDLRIPLGVHKRAPADRAAACAACHPEHTAPDWSPGDDTSWRGA